MSRELGAFLATHAVKNTTTINTAIGEIELMMLNAGHAVELSKYQGAEFQLAVAALALSKDGERYSDAVGFSAALKQVKSLELKVALKIGEEAIAFSKLTDEAVEESGKDLNPDSTSTE